MARPPFKKRGGLAALGVLGSFGPLTSFTTLPLGVLFLRGVGMKFWTTVKDWVALLVIPLILWGVHLETRLTTLEVNNTSINVQLALKSQKVDWQGDVVTLQNRVDNIKQEVQELKDNGKKTEDILVRLGQVDVKLGILLTALDKLQMALHQ